MGSYRSGRYRGRKLTTDCVHRISIYDLQHAGALKLPLKIEYLCSDADKNLIIRSDPKGMSFNASVQGYDSEEIKILLFKVPAGRSSGEGHRIIAYCPRCWESVTHIYFIYGDKILIAGCRHCFNLTYRSSQLSKNWPRYYAFRMYMIEDKLGIPRCEHDGPDGFSMYYTQALKNSVPSKMNIEEFKRLWDQLKEAYTARVHALGKQ